MEHPGSTAGGPTPSQRLTEDLALLDLLGDATIIVDAGWRLIAGNAAVERVLGRSPANAGGEIVWDLWPALRAEPLAARLRQAMAARQPVQHEQELLAPPDRGRILDVRAAPYEAGLAIVVRDLTLQRRRETRSSLLRELTAALSSALNPEEVGTVIIGRAMPALGANAGNVYLLDDDAGALVSVAAMGYAPEVIARTRRLPLDGPSMMAEVTRTGGPILIEDWDERVRRYPHHRHDHALEGDRSVAGLPLKVEGRTIGALSLAFPGDRTFDDDERQFIATVADLCAQALARARLYEALRRSEAQARLVTDRAPAFLAHIDTESRYLYVNDGFAERLGLTPEQIIGRHVSEVVGEAAYAALREKLEIALAGQEVEFEAEVPYAVLGPRFVKIAYAPDRDERGRMRGVVAVITDTTERQRAERARQILADAGAILGASLDPETILREVARVSVEGFATHCVAWLKEDAGLRQAALTRDASATDDLPLPPLPEILADAVSPAAVPRHPIVTSRPVASITVPLHARDRLIGALQFVMSDRVSFDDLWLAEELGRRCAAALENSRLYQSLQESEARFRQLADAIPNIAWVIGANGATLEYVNRRWLDNIGVEITPGATPLVNDWIHPDDRKQAVERWSAAVRAGASFTTELRLRTTSGAYRWFLYRTEPVRDAAGRVVKWFGAATDINDTKRAEASHRFLAELSSVLAILLDPAEILRRVARLVIPTLADYCFIDLVQPDGGIRRVAWAHADPDEQRLFDEQMTKLVPPALDRGHPIARAIESGQPWRVADVDDAWLAQIAFSPEHLEFVRGRRLRSRLTMPLRARGRTLGALTLCFSELSGRRYGTEDLDLARDVAERIALAVDNARLYTESREAEAKVQRLLDAGVVGIVVADRERILEANDHFLEMVGYPREALERGQLHWPSMTPPEFASQDERAIEELLNEGVWSPFEKEFIRRDGSRIPILIGAAILEHDPLRWIGFVLDLTEQKRGEDAWRAFVDATAHDLRNPLTSVLGQTQLLQRRLKRDGILEPDDVAPRLAAIAASSLRAAGLIDDLIDTARLRAGQALEMRFAPVDLLALVTACAEEARRVGPSHAVHVESSASPLMVMADAPRLERVIRNILDNAIKYSPDGGEVRVRLRREREAGGDWVVLSITDQGMGIPATDLPYVFERFRRGANVAGAIHGSGIGLTGARQIVADHGGEIGVESTEGQGSTFTLRLPLLSEEDATS